MRFDTGIARQVSQAVGRGRVRAGWVPRRRSWRGYSVLFGLGFLLALLSPMVASALPPAFTLGGTAFRSWDPTVAPMTNFVVAMDTSGPGSFGYATAPLDTPPASLTGFLAVDYYLAGRDCGGGSPRISLSVDTDGDGVSDGHAFGYVGPSPSFTGCSLNSWQHADLTDGASRWDLTQLGGPFYNTWSQALAFFAEMPYANIVRGSLVDDSAWVPSAAGLAYYDNLVIGDLLLSSTEDVISSEAPVHLDVASDHVVDFDFGTIQAAVNAAAGSGDTVLVDPGTYSELVVITKSVTLTGAQAGVSGCGRSGPESVVGAPNGAFQILADNVVIDGFTITGVDWSGGVSSMGAGIHTTGTYAGHIIRNNIITGNPMGLYLNSDGTFPSIVEDNFFDSNNAPGPGAGNGIYSDQGANDVAIRDNCFTGHDNDAILFAGGSWLGNTQSAITVSGNTIEDDAGGVAFWFASDLAITGNTWHDILYTSVFLGGDVHDVAITENTFDSAGFRGIRISAGAIGFDTGLDSDIRVNFNNFLDNTEEGLRVDTASYTGTLDATCNWWGDPSGPTTATNPSGLGDDVFDPDGVVDYTPWLGQPTPDPCGGPVHLDIGSNGIIDVNFGAIQPAVNTAGDGDTVYVDPGVYTEQVVIDAGIRLVSSVTGGATIRAPPFAGRSTFTIPSSGRTWDAIVEIRSDDASIEGFVIDGFERGGFCPSRSFTGIMMHGGVGMAALDNTVTGIRDTPFSGCQAGTGIAVYPDAEGAPASAEVSGNAVMDYQKGGIVVNVDGAMADVHDNVVEGVGPTAVIAQNGIQFGFGAGGSASGNAVTGHAYSGGFWTSAGILLFEAADGVLVEDNLVMDNQVGIDVWGSSGVTVQGNDVAIGPSGLFSACGGPLGATDLFGIHFQDSQGTIEDNDVMDIAFQAGARGCQSGDGIVLDGGTLADVIGNRVTGYQKTGILAGRFSNDVDDSGLSAFISGNTVTGWGMTPLIAQNGIQISDGAAGAIVGNAVSGNWYSPCGDYLTCYNAAGVLVVASDGVLVADNTLTGNQAGVNLFDTGAVGVVGNTITGSAWAIIVDTSDPLVAGNTIGAPTVGPGAVQIVGIWALFSTDVDVMDNVLDFGGAVAPVGTLYGIYFQDASGTISGNDVLNVRMSDAYFGLQTGVGILATGTGNVDIASNLVEGYQKGGIVVGRASIPFVGRFSILDNTVVGRGPTPLTAQNGIQVSGPDATGEVSGNRISGNEYTGCSNKDAAKTGCTPWVAAGLLLYNVHANLIKHSQNEYRDNQRNLVMVTTQSLGF